MSTRPSGLKSNCDVSTELRSVCAENSSPRRPRARGFQETREKKCFTRASTECIQIAKNLQIRRRTLLKSKGEWVSAPESQDESRGQPRFTSSFSLRFPSTKRENYRANIRLATKLRINDLHTKSDAGTKVADGQRPEFGEKDFLVDTLREPTGRTTKDEDVSKSSKDTISSRGNHGANARPSDGVQRGLDLCDRGHPANICAQGHSAGSEHVLELRVTECKTAEGQSGLNYPRGQNEEGKFCHRTLISFREDTGSKADSDCQVDACSPSAINQALSLPSFPASPDSNNLKSDLISSSAAMFTSTIVSVLAPHWSGRLRRHKRGFSDAGPDTAQSANQSALSQNEQQQRFPLQQIQAPSEPVNDFSDRFKGSAGANRSSDEWQNESFLHLSESKSQFLKTSSVRMNRHAEDQRQKFMSPMHVSVDSSEVPRSAMSLQVHNYRRMAQSVDQGESFSSLRSRPTTSTLLLSSRRMNSRKPIPQSFQMNRQLSASISSLNLPSKSILRSSQPQLNLVSSNDPAEQTLLRKNFLASSDQLSVTHKPKPLSPNWAERDFSTKHRYLITGNFDKAPPATDDTTRERLFSNYTTRFNQSETLRSAQDHGAVDRRITSTKTVQDFNSKISERSGTISPKENANSVFVFPQPLTNFNSDNVLKRHISKISMTSTNREPSTSMQSSIINNMNNSSKTSTTNSSTSPQTIQPFATSPSVILTPAPMMQADQNNVQNSRKPSSSPVNSLNMRTFTESLNFSPRKDSVEEISPSHLWSNYLNTKSQENTSNLSPLDQQSSLSPSEFKPRRVCIPSIYTYLRETSSPKSTQASPALSSPSPQNLSLKQIQEENKNSRKLQFTFDLNSFESQDPLLKSDSSSTSAPQSLPLDTGKTVSRISQSPYSTLISTRAAVKSISSPPVGQQHSRSLSYGSSPVDAKSPKVGKRSYTSVIRDRMNQRKLSLGEQVGATNIQPATKTDSIYQNRVSKSSTDAKFPDCQTNTLIPTATHPKQTDMSTTVIKNIPHEEHNGIFLSRGDKNNTYANDTLNAKDLSFSLGPSRVSEEMQKEGLTGIAQTNRTFQESPSTNSKKSLFSMRSKKENVLSSSPSASKEGLAVKNGEMTGIKTKKVDQVLNRLRQTFGGKFSEDSDITNKRKTKKEEAFNIKAFESVKKEKESDHLTVTRQTELEEVLDMKTPERARKLDRMVNQTVRTQAKPEEVLYIKASDMTRKLDRTVDLTVRTQTKPEKVLDFKASDMTRKLDQTVDLTVRTQTKPEKVLDFKASDMTRKLDRTVDLTVRTQTKPEKVLDFKASDMTRKLDRTVDLTVRTQTKPEKVLDISASDMTRKLDRTVDLTVRAQTKPEKVLDFKASDITRKLDRTVDLTVRTQTKPEKVLDIKASERTRNLDQTVDLTVRTRTKPEEISDSKTSERNRKRDQMVDLTFRTQTKPEKVLERKASERTSKLDQMVNLTFRTRTEPEEVLNIKASERTRKLDQTGDLTFRTRTKPEEVLDSMASERTSMVDQTDDLTVRRKINNETRLDIMTSKTRRKAEQRLSPIQTVKSPNSPKIPFTFMTDPCDSSSTTLDFRQEKQDISPNKDNHKRLKEEGRNQHLGRPLSPNWLAPDNINFYATLPLGKRSRLGPSPTPSPYECVSEDEQSDNVFFSNVLTKRKNTSFGESENVAQQNNSVKIWEQKSSGVKSSSPCADLKYGLHRGRSVSVSSVVSGRPSGPGRISTGSRQSSISDLSSLDGFVSKSRHSSMNSPVGSPENQISYKGPSGWLSSERLLRSPDNLEAISFLWDMETDPTPPSSPPYARRMSQVSSPSSASSWTSPDSSSPRGFLPSRTYRSTLSAFEESGSESTTDDEYYLNSDDDDEKETEL